MAIDPRTLYKNADLTGETARAQRQAEQYGFDYVDLEHFQIAHALYQSSTSGELVRLEEC